MLKNIVTRNPVQIIERSIEFTTDDGCGFSFDCDSNGKPTFSCAEARKNYEYAIAHPEEFVEYNELVVRKRAFIEPATALVDVVAMLHS